MNNPAPAPHAAKPDDGDTPDPPQSRLYRVAPWLTVRTPQLPAACEELSKKPRTALENSAVIRALAIASPDLLAALRRDDATPRDADRAARSLARYLTRMSTRPTPYGSFATVSLAQWAPLTTLELSPAHRSRTRPDMAWVRGLLASVEGRSEARRNVCWRADPLAYQWGDRWYSGITGNSIRNTEAVTAVLHAARNWTSHSALLECLRAWSNGATPHAERLLEAMHRSGLLKLDLTPQLTGTAAMSGSDTSTILHQVRPDLADAFDRLLARMNHADELAGDESAGAYTALDSAAATVLPGSASPRFQTDERRLLKGDGLNPKIGRELAEAAELLLRITPAPAGSADLETYTRSFLSRYGERRPIPLLELFDPVRGLGPVPHTHGAAPGVPRETTARRNGTLINLALGALRDGTTAVTLDDGTVTDLETWSPKQGRTPLSLDLAAFVVARTPADVDRGRYQLVLGPNVGASSAGRWLGRFADLFPEDAPRYYQWLDGAERQADLGAVPAEVVYLPELARPTNVVLRPVFGNHEIVVSGRGGATDPIDLNDLWVTAHQGLLHLYSRRLGARIRPTARHMLNQHAAPPVCQFLELLSHADSPELMGFDWGPAKQLPFTPRVERGRVVLAPAQWRLTKSGLHDGSARPPAGTRRAVAFAQEQWNLPERVYLTVADNRLLLDLSREDDIDQLCREIDKAGSSGVQLDEALPDVDDAWVPGPGGGYITEVVISLVRQQPCSKSRAAGDSAGPAPIAYDEEHGQQHPRRMDVEVRERARPPGSDWLFAKFYAPYEQLTPLLVGPLNELISMADTSGLADQWFFVRYGDPDPHLRLRWHGDPDLLLHHLLPQVTDFSDQLISSGRIQRLALDTYDREVERYGGPVTINISERVFDADSRLALRLLSHPELDLTEGFVTSTITLLHGLSIPTSRRIALYRQQLRANSDPNSRKRAGDDYRIRKDRLRKLASGTAAGSTIEGVLQPAALELRKAIKPCAHAYIEAQATGSMHGTMDDLCLSLVHMHHNRLVGPSSAPAELHGIELLLRTEQGLQAAPYCTR